ncbi:MAG TPA: TolC family protein [Bryobacteraceae bacterium]|nr:TolC family protein [Bryobacteraceae bacterium]
MKNYVVRVFLAISMVGEAYVSMASGDAGVVLPEDVMPQLKPLIEQAMRQSPRMLEQNLSLAQSEADWYMARASSLPSVGGYAVYQLQQETRADAVRQNGMLTDVSSRTDKYYYNIMASQAVWHWGALEASRKIARIDRELATINYDEAYRALAAEVRASYLGLVLSRMAVRNAGHVLRMAQENLARQQVRYSANQITYGQIMQDQLQVDDASLNERRARADFDFVLGAFRALTGNDQFAEADIPDSITDVTRAPAVASVVASSLGESSVSIRAAEKTVARAKLGLIGPRFNLYPKLSALAGGTRDEINRDINQYNKYQVDTWYVGAQINWSIFDGFSTKGQKLAAYTRLRRAEQQLARLRESLPRNLERERLNVGFTWEAYQNAKMRLRMAREQVEYMLDLLARGEASQDRVDVARAAMNTQLYNTQSALAAHFGAAVQYLSSQGLDPLGKPAVKH